MGGGILRECVLQHGKQIIERGGVGVFSGVEISAEFAGTSPEGAEVTGTEIEAGTGEYAEGGATVEGVRNDAEHGPHILYLGDGEETANVDDFGRDACCFECLRHGEGVSVAGDEYGTSGW